MAARRSSTSARCSGEASNAAGIVAQTGADIFHADAGGFERGHRLLKLRLVAGQFFDMLLRRAQRRGGRGVAFVQQIEGVHGRAVDLFGVGQHPLLGFETLVFSRLQLGVFDFASLEGPQIEKAQAVLLVALKIINTSLDALPFGERFRRQLRSGCWRSYRAGASRVDASKESSDSFWA